MEAISRDMELTRKEIASLGVQKQAHRQCHGSRVTCRETARGAAFACRFLFWKTFLG